MTAPAGLGCQIVLLHNKSCIDGNEAGMAGKCELTK